MSDIRNIIDDFDDEFLENLLEDICNEIGHIERYLMNDQLFFSDANLKNQALESINAINLICQKTFIEPLRFYAQILEDFFVEVCNGRFGSSPWVTELMLLLVDEAKASFEDLEYRRTLDVALLDSTRLHIKELLNYSGDDYEKLIRGVISEFALRVHPDLVLSNYDTVPTESHPVGGVEEFHQSHQSTDIPPQANLVNDPGLESLKEFADALDNRSELWEGRTQSILENCLLINKALANHIDEKQLTAAVYMHDVGMALMPDAVLFKEGKYDAVEIMLLQQHPIQIYGLMQQMKEWLEAAEMVHQHHEHFNGHGYPNGASGSDIHMGAKIIAVADAFYSLTHNRMDRGFKKSLTRAVAEINKNNGTQFDPQVIEAFNLVLLEKARNLS